jgi:phosphatidylinositol glycan class V
MSETRKHLRLLDSLTLLSRVSVAALLYLTSSYLPLFDASPHTVLAPSSTLPSFSSSLLRWDAFHFTAIAKAGYSREHHWAFFPAVPLLLRFAARFSPPVDDSTFALARVALIHAAFAIPTTRAIYHLTLTHFRSPSFSLLVALLSLLPASPVALYFAPYAEPIFTFLSYAGVSISPVVTVSRSDPRAPQECSPARAGNTSALRCTLLSPPPFVRMASCSLYTSLGP